MEVTVHRGGTWAQRGEVTFPRSHSWKVEELGLASSLDLGACLPEGPPLHQATTHWHSVSTPSSWQPHEIHGVITSVLQVQKRPRGAITSPGPCKGMIGKGLESLLIPKPVFLLPHLHPSWPSM